MEKELLLRMEKKLKKISDDEIFCVYIDFPFCRSKCDYCIYKSISYKDGLNKREEYVEAVKEQLKIFKILFEIKIPDSIYFGGGTPSLWSTDELDYIVDSINNYNLIKMKKSEAHPYDLNDERIKYYAEKLNLDVISLGVQSFDKNACIGQNRIWVDKDSIKHIVSEFHKYDVKVNIDLVALFNGDEEEDWKIFEEDMNIVCNEIKPDIITSIPNYKTKLVYLEQLPRFRSILKEYVGDIYFPAGSKMLSLNYEDIKKYGENDHWIATKDYWIFQDSNVRYSSSHPSPKCPPKQITLSFGGAGNHVVYSYISSDNYVVYSAYNFEKHKFDYFDNHIITNS